MFIHALLNLHRSLASVKQLLRILRHTSDVIDLKCGENMELHILSCSTKFARFPGLSFLEQFLNIPR